MSGQSVKAIASFHVPQANCGVKGGRGQHEVGIGVGSSWSGARPFDCVDFLRVGLQIVDARVHIHAPDLESHVVGTACQKLSLRIPLNCIDLQSKNDNVRKVTFQ